MEFMTGRQPAAAAVRTLLREARHGDARLFMSAVNVGEVYYFLRKNHGRELAESWRDKCRLWPVRIEVPTMAEIWDAAALKGDYPISYADAFAAAVAQKYACPLVTGDPEFFSVEGLQLDWIGP
jgi:predicted nucleic acid-binding protein